MIIEGIKNWKNYYKTSKIKRNTWIVVTLSDERDLYLEGHKDWINLKEEIAQTKNKIHAIGLQYRSHRMETANDPTADGFYVVPTAKGEYGGDTKQCYTVGIIHGDKIDKCIWITPELVPDDKYIDTLDRCFPEAIILHDKEETQAI